MDSMRHLSTSLPQTSRRRTDPTADLLPDFKQAALSVTNLYKAAHSAQTKARAAGYQDALDDLLAFLDKENLGLMDGEGWRVRQWATQNLDGDDILPQQPEAIPTRTSGEDDSDIRNATERDEDKEDDTYPTSNADRTVDMSSSALTAESAEEDVSSQRRVVSEPPQTQPQHFEQPHPPRGDFTFQSSYSNGHNHDRDPAQSGMDLDSATTQSPIFLPSAAPPTADAVRLLPRAARNVRHAGHNRRADQRGAPLNFNLGNGAGNKRKMPYSDFFDISGFSDNADRKDNGPGSGGASSHPGRGGKRGRHV